MDSEKWIWLELFAFDPEKDDCGVESYIKNAGFIPNGVSLLLNAIDFVLLYDGMDREYPLFDEVNGRGSGHKKWTNYRLRQLINELQKNGIKVFFSVFTFYWKNKSRTEFIAAHPECAVVYSEQGKTRAVDVLAKLDNGQYLEDIFAANLYRIMCDYRFNGWHGPDWFGPGGSLKGSCSDNIVSQFIEFLGGNIPEGLEPVTDDQPEKENEDSSADDQGQEDDVDYKQLYEKEKNLRETLQKKRQSEDTSGKEEQKTDFQIALEAATSILN